MMRLRMKSKIVVFLFSGQGVEYSEEKENRSEISDSGLTKTRCGIGLSGLACETCDL
jgi:hypothetical protein